jgi:hypothetical protein
MFDHNTQAAGHFVGVFEIVHSIAIVDAKNGWAKHKLSNKTEQKTF